MLRYKDEFAMIGLVSFMAVIKIDYSGYADNNAATHDSKLLWSRIDNSQVLRDKYHVTPNSTTASFDSMLLIGHILTFNLRYLELTSTV